MLPDPNALCFEYVTQPQNERGDGTWRSKLTCPEVFMQVSGFLQPELVF